MLVATIEICNENQVKKNECMVAICDAIIFICFAFHFC
jgi:hypothetical protein